MRDYELTLVIDPDITEENRKKLNAKVKKLIEGLKGRVVSLKEWGKKTLAYPIKKKNLGYYFFWEIRLPEANLNELNKKIKLEEKIVRCLIVRSEYHRGEEPEKRKK